MFNLSTSGHASYNGISQLSDNQCAFSDEKESTSRTRYRAYMTSDRQNRLKITSSGSINNSTLSKLNLPPSKEDVYAFEDFDHTFNKIPEPHHRGSLTYNKTESLSVKKNISGSLVSSPKKIQISKPVNGLNACKDNDRIYKTPVHEQSFRYQINKLSSPHRIAVKQNKDLFAPTLYSRNVKSEPDLLSSKIHNNGLNNFTKNSITNVNIKPVKSLNHVKKSEVKQDPGKYKIGADAYTSSYSNYLQKNSSKSVPKKSPSGKSPPKSNSGKRGRGPALHESLQRIKPIVKQFNVKTEIIDNDHWHSPGSDVFDCGVLESYHCDKSTNDSSDDDLLDHVNHWFYESNTETMNKEEKSMVSRASLRRRITQLKQLEAISNSSKSSSSLYNTIKLQLTQHMRNCSSDTYRVQGSALNLLLGPITTNDFLSSDDKRMIKKEEKTTKSTLCSHPDCVRQSLAHAQFCLQHISQSPGIFSPLSENMVSQVPDQYLKSEVILGSQHTWKKDNYGKLTQNSKSKRSSRKRPVANKLQPIEEFQNVKDINTHFHKYPDNSDYLLSKDIDHTVTSSIFLQNDATDLNVCSNSSACESSEDTGIGGLSDSELIASVNNPQHIDPDVVFAMHDEAEDLPTLDLPPPGPPQEPNIDLSTVFNDFFAEQNGEYIPSREETEELERALEAVNQDVKSLEKLAGSQHSSLLLDTFLDERVFAETLASLPDVFNTISTPKITSGSILDPTPSPS